MSSFFAVGVEVVSIDAIKKEPNGAIIGIALIKVCSSMYGSVKQFVLLSEHITKEVSL